MRLGIGTVQFGVNYGIANKIGKVAKIDQIKILDLANKHNISLIDTAINYGDSEKNLGEYGLEKFNVVSKIPEIPKNLINVEKWITDQVKKSILKLGVKSLYGVLLHRANQLFDYDGKIITYLEKLKNDGLVKKIGISIYAPDELENILANFSIDIVQAPMNLIDRRLKSSGYLKLLKKKKIEVHIRSIFLQGLLLIKKDSLPLKFEKWKNLLEDWYYWLDENPKLSALDICINYIKSIHEIDKIIVGVDSCNQLEEVLKSYSLTEQFDFPEISCNDEQLLNPSNW